MNKQELIKRISELPYSEGPIADTVTVNRNWILGSIEQLDEPQKVTVPQFVADLIEYAKIRDWDLEDVFLNIANELDTSEISEWFYTQGNMDVIARAWLDGYEIEKEKRYEVILCNGQSLKTVYRQGEDRLDFEKVYGDIERFTRKQLEEAGFGWVFDCPGVEVEEVEG